MELIVEFVQIIAKLVVEARLQIVRFAFQDS